MPDEAEKGLALGRIRENIARSGHHIYVVSADATPRFVFMIETIGVELILAGLLSFSATK
jgi:hypothetical protein